MKYLVVIKTSCLKRIVEGALILIPSTSGGIIFPLHFKLKCSFNFFFKNGGKESKPKGPHLNQILKLTLPISK